MKAAVIHQHGDASQIHIEDLPTPRPGAGAALLEVRAAALNHLDIWVRRGGRATLKMPHILGSDASGVVAELGPGVEGLTVGQEVVLNPGVNCGKCEFCRAGQTSLCTSFGIIGMAHPGTFAQYVAVPARNLRPKPPHLSFSLAAGLTLAHLTAWRMLVTRGRLVAGETVLIHGIGGGVAMAAMQFAHAMGAVTIVTSSSKHKLSRATELGASHAVHYGKTDVAAAVREITAGRGVDLVIDTVGQATLETSVAALRRGGRIVTCGVTSGSDAHVNLQAVYWDQLEILGSTLGTLEEHRQMLAAVESLRLSPEVDSVYPLADVQKATQRIESGEQFGKVVLEI